MPGEDVIKRWEVATDLPAGRPGEPSMIAGAGGGGTPGGPAGGGGHEHRSRRITRHAAWLREK